MKQIREVLKEKYGNSVDLMEDGIVETIAAKIVKDYFSAKEVKACQCDTAEEVAPTKLPKLKPTTNKNTIMYFIKEAMLSTIERDVFPKGISLFKAIPDVSVVSENDYLKISFSKFTNTGELVNKPRLSMYSDKIIADGIIVKNRTGSVG